MESVVYVNDLSEQIQKADDVYREDYERFQCLVGKVFNRILVEILYAIRQGRFVALEEGVYRSSVEIEPTIMEALKEHVTNYNEKHKDEILYFKQKYKDTWGSPKRL
jgi:hypothetical protein